MAPLTPPPKIELSRLRDIGWSVWDPIGLLSSGRSWHDDECRAFADEYDGYLLKAAGLLRSGANDAEVVNYLVHIEAECMGLGQSANIRERAQLVVTAIRGDHNIWRKPEN